MAARVLLLSILFTEVLKPVCIAGVRGVGSNVNEKEESKSEDLHKEQISSSEITLETKPSGHVVLGRKGITLSCSADSIRDVSWLRNGVLVPPCDPTRCTLLRNGSLHFYKKQNLQMVQKDKRWDSDDAVSNNAQSKNEYRCIARTAYGGLLRSSPIFIQMAELSYVFKESPDDLTVREGEVARFSCIIDSIPFPPNITWQRNGETVLSDHSNKKYSMILPGVLYISATKLSDAGSYRCIVTNEFLKKTKKSKEAKLTVLLKPDDKGLYVPASLFPQISYSYWLTNGSNLSLVCAASGYPSFVTWTFIPRYTDNTTVQLSHVLLNSANGISVLTLNNANASYAGIYVCSTKNSINDVLQVQNITVDVLEPPSFLKKPVNQICPNGRTARFECQAEGRPTPQIYWLKDASNVTLNGRRTLYVKTFNRVELAISATVPSDSGIYQCVAVNAAGEIWAAGRLQVNSSRNSPAAPASLKCHSLSPVKIFLSWEPPKSLPSANITAYTVHYSPVEEGGKEEVSSPVAGNSTSVEVTKLLEPYTNYSFYVRLWNIYGASDQSATIMCSTAPSVPKAAPKITLDVISSTKLNVTWRPLSKKEARGVVVEYKLQRRLHQQPSIRVVNVPSRFEHYVFIDLIPGTRYDFRILARTDQGWPNISEAQLDWTSVTMPSSKSDEFPISNTVDLQLMNVNSSVVKVKWKMKTEASELEFDSWQLYCEDKDGQKYANISLPKNVTEYLLIDLEANVLYVGNYINCPYLQGKCLVGLCMVNIDIVVSCVTRHIESVQLGTSGIPISLEATPVSATSINVTWIVTNMNNVNSYEVCYHAVHAVDSETSSCIVTDDNKATVNNLKPFTLYQFKVRVLSNDTSQSSLYSEPVECYTKEDIPEEVEEVESFLDNATKVRIVWKESSNQNGIIQNYFVTYTMNLSDSTSTRINITVPGNETAISLPSLSPGKRYYVMVQAATKAGCGKLSNPIVVESALKTSTTLNEEKSPQKPQPDQSLGVILGVSISIGCIAICLCSIYCRRKCENSRPPENSARSLKGRILLRNGNGCCVDRSSISVSQHVNTTVACNEIELAVLCPSSPVTTNPHSDAKGGRSNGILESCAKEPLLTPWDLNGESKDLSVTEDPQYKRRSSVVSSQREEQESNLEATQLTMVNCTLDSSDSNSSSSSSSSSLKNNVERSENDSSLRKVVSTTVPILGPNG